MFREVSRNSKQILSAERCEAILNKATSGVLNLLGDDDYPYGVPISYAYKDGRLYFHGMPCGHKMDAMTKHEKASFTIIETDQVVAEEYTSYFRSVIVFGKMRVLEKPGEKVEGLMNLVDKYSADYRDGGMDEINGKLNGVSVFVLEIEHISGKEASEFVGAK